MNYKKRITGFLTALLLLTMLGANLSLPIAENAPHAQKTVTVLETLIPAATANTLEDVINEVKAEKAKAPSSTGGASKATDPKEFINRIARLNDYVNLLFDPLIAFLTFKIGALLDNDFIYAGKMEEMLQSLWRVNRNIVNIAFVLILLYLALKYIFAGDGESTDLKKILPQFAIMLIAVNFSWLACKVVLDASNVAANIAFSLPAAAKQATPEDIFKVSSETQCQTDGAKGQTQGMCVPVRVFNPTESLVTKNLPISECINADGTVKEEIKKGYADAYPETGVTEASKLSYYHGLSIFCWKQVDVGAYDKNNASFYLTYSMAKVQKIAEASKSGGVKLSIGILFGVVLQIIYIVSFGALFVTLLVRIGVLWLFVALSPILVLMMFLKKNVAELGGGSETLSTDTFVQWAFAPAIVGVVWSIGFAMVSAGQAATTKFLGSLKDKDLVSSDSPGVMLDIESLFMGMNDLDQFVWLLMTIIIIWVGTFAVLKKLKFIGDFMGKIDGYGTTLAKYIAESPTWAPIVPIYDHKTGGWKGGSLLSVVPDFNQLISEYKYSQKSDKGVKGEIEQGKQKLTKLDDETIAKLRGINDREKMIGELASIMKMDRNTFKDTTKLEEIRTAISSGLQSHIKGPKTELATHINNIIGAPPAGAAESGDTIAPSTPSVPGTTPPTTGTPPGSAPATPARS